MITLRSACLLLPAAMLMTFTGCGGYENVAPVTGKVTLDGEPAADVMVTFVPEAGGAASTGITDAQGNYELSYLDAKGALIGKHRVMVTSVGPTSAAQVPSDVSSDDPRYAEAVSGDYAEMSKAQSVEERIPGRYNTNSELVKEVTDGENVINLELTTQ